VAWEREKLKAKEAYLATERQRLGGAHVAFNAVDASACAAKWSLNLYHVVVLIGI
jgi:hypothetical protein